MVAALVCGQSATAQAPPKPLGVLVPQGVVTPPLTHFTQELRGVGPGAIPVAVPDGTRTFPNGQVADHYSIDINEFTDTLHPDLGGPTTLWGYNPRTALGVTGIPVQKHLGGIIVAQRGHPAQLTFHNNLPNAHILPVDATLMGAQGAVNRTSTHLHGGFIPWISDGGPFNNWDPQGGKGTSFINNQVLRPGEVVPANEAEYYYPNDQSARLMWYHDHSVGITRPNAYAGIASAYILRDAFEASLVRDFGLPQFIEKGGRELPIVFQDKIFQTAAHPDPAFPGSAVGPGDLYYPYVYNSSKWELGPGAPPPVSIVPEMFGDTMLVNGAPYPKATVDPRRYRLRILNACQARFLNLQLYEDNGAGRPDFTRPGPNWTVIGTEGGFLAHAVNVPSGVPLNTVADSLGNRAVDPANPGGSLIMAPGERLDVLVDFHGNGGKKYIMWNDSPGPYPGGSIDNDFPNAAGDGDTQTLLRFEVKADSPAIPRDKPLRISPAMQLAGFPDAKMDQPLAGPVSTTPIPFLSWNTTPAAPLPIPIRRGVTVRQLTLNETFDADGRLVQMLGTNVAPVQVGDFTRAYADPTTETVKAGATEVWQIANLTADTHPIHIHLVNIQILSRQPFDTTAYLAAPVGQAASMIYTGPARGPETTEIGWKETIKMHPGEVTTVIMKFDLPRNLPFVVPPSPRTGGAEYVWHCHILEHEEHDMMRPLVVK
ncbi:MAG: multicopper oxidase domain-containing protein [Geothrix sp.]|uniref:multicopper oxidase family protein n=1 Tax=Geothrix sp. TaxID=1962974 RepID=UPI00182BBC20|nr:multicopper oxidase domain-containing protein [Geothrix sp.]NWJ41041.1 multicopper oxidase domain-containing protein [Geothrix sp.]WIL20962.1 MAG: multicopper oxidase domain-containing protein [Geothrix sp.]